VKRAPYIAGAVAVVVALLVALFALSPSDDERPEAAPLVGRVAPAIDATSTTGQRFRLDDQRGSWVLVNFFATWCAPCKAELPELAAFAAENAPQASVVSVAFDKTESRKVVTSFFSGTDGTWPVITKGGSTLAIDWGVIKLPESYLVAPTGKVVLKVNGGVRADELESYIAKAEGR
jgi:thiol-disulfide isomerase/thioredoxin